MKHIFVLVSFLKKRNTFISFSSFINIFMASKSFFPFRRKILPSWKHILCSFFFSFVKKNATLGLFCIFLFGSKMFVLKYKHFHRSHSSVPFGEKFSPYGYTFSIYFFKKRRTFQHLRSFLFLFLGDAYLQPETHSAVFSSFFQLQMETHSLFPFFLLSSPHETHSVVFCRVSQELDKNTFRCVFFESLKSGKI